jgi:hypothetical protein
MKQHPIRVSAVAGTIALVLSLHTATAAVATFETVALAPETHWDGSDLSGTAGPAGSFGEIPYSQFRQTEGSGFLNTYTAWGGYGSWSGFAFSNHTDTATAGFLNQYSAFAGGGAGGSSQYAIGYYSGFSASTNVSLGALTNLAGLGASITNTTYAALSMRDGDSFTRKFGDVSGNAPDWLLLTIQGYAAGALTGSVDFYLADFSSADSAQDYIVKDWRFVDFSALGTVDEIRFSMSSSDSDPIYGMNTPSFFALDNFLAVPEPSSLLVALSGLGLLARRKR